MTNQSHHSSIILLWTTPTANTARWELVLFAERVGIPSPEELTHSITFFYLLEYKTSSYLKLTKKKLIIECFSTRNWLSENSTGRNYPLCNIHFIFRSIRLPRTWNRSRTKLMTVSFSRRNWLSDKNKLVLNKKMFVWNNPGGSSKRRCKWRNGMVHLTRNFSNKNE